MRPSSISSSEAAPRRAPAPSRRWGAFALIVLALVGAAEVALRWPQARALLPPRTHYYHPAIAQRIEAIERVKQVHGRVDVLFIGSSIVLTNVHPLLFDSLAATDDRRLVSFNAGLAGLWPSSVHLYAEHLWLPIAAPRVVVQGVRFAELAATTHAKHETQVWSGRIEPSWRDASLLTRLNAAAVERIYLLQYLGVLTRLLERFRDGWVGAPEPDEDERYAVRGYLPQGGPAIRGTEALEGDLPNEGTCANGGCRFGFEALRRTIAAVRAAGGTYVLVNVPEHPARWRGPGAAERYRRYIEAVARFAAREEVRFIDPTDGDPFRFAGVPYSDLAHMTAAGSRQFTRELAFRLAPVADAARRGARTLRAAEERRPPVVTPAGASGRRGPG